MGVNNNGSTKIVCSSWEICDILDVVGIHSCFLMQYGVLTEHHTALENMSVKYAHSFGLCRFVLVIFFPIPVGFKWCIYQHSSVYPRHHIDIIMSVMVSQITSLTIVCSSIYSGADQRKHQSSASLAFEQGIHRWPVNSSHKGPVTLMTSSWTVLVGQALLTIVVAVVSVRLTLILMDCFTSVGQSMSVE